ncbi:hypothetical protein GCM10007425_20910 [Lysinibacillus alkalisoli]|uniref:Luciferase-like domain-containing protein n=1 Tax=Lysinibacillus alkalisoli TaxID=1911548 RepID=A0A917G7T7_9BACI|nr:NtaA/DmoA family FMN-dependent monooxygenase [Lysinibacillus alkalisoli]GGG26167.1 hypothetical protein GCM10007425_20910 [Lysinibacillus alkalisoli]
MTRQLTIGIHLSAASDTNSIGPAIDEQIAFVQRAEAAKLDFVFKADYLVAHPALMAKTKTTVNLDPSLLFATLARETTHIGLVTTISTSFNPPYVIARQLQSLNWISNGRIGWNVVTSIDGAKNFGEDAMLPSQQRYEKAKECTDVVHQLWHSYPYEAMKAKGDMEKIQASVKPIHYEGKYFKVEGPLSVPMHPAGDIPLFQAGASDVGRQFAATVSNAIFAATPTMEAGIALRKDLRQRAQALGRSADAIRVLPGLYFFIGDTYDEAWQMYYEAHAHLTVERKLQSLQAVIGKDFSDLGLTDTITIDMLPEITDAIRSKTHATLLRDYVANYQPTLEQLLWRPEVIGSAHLVAIGTPKQIVNQIKTFYDNGALDGFIGVPGNNASLTQFYEQVIPLLVESGLFRQKYNGSTLREHLQL